MIMPRLDFTQIGTWAFVLTGLVAILHLYFMILEMWLWDTAYGRKTFGMTPDYSAQSKSLAANQGLYNGFLAAGLIWALSLGAVGFEIRVFFLICVILAGIYGGLTVGRKILLVQALPAALALSLSLFAHPVHLSL